MQGGEVVATGLGNAASSAGKKAGTTFIGRLLSPRETNAKKVLSTARRRDNQLAHSINDTKQGQATKIKLSKDKKDGLHVITNYYHGAFGALAAQHEFTALQLNTNEVDSTRGGCSAFFFGEAINSYTLALPPRKDGETFYSADDAKTTTALRTILEAIDTQKTLHDDWALAALLYLRLNEQVEQLAHTYPDNKEELYSALKLFVGQCEESLEGKNCEYPTEQRAKTIDILSKLKADKNQRDKASSRAENLSNIIPKLKNKIGTLTPSVESIALQFIKGKPPGTKEINPDMDVLLTESSTIEFKYGKWPVAHTPSGWLSWNVTNTKSDHYGKIISIRNLVKKSIKYFYLYAVANKSSNHNINTLEQKHSNLGKIIATMTRIEELTSELCLAAKQGNLDAYDSDAIIAHTISQLVSRRRIFEYSETKRKIKEDDIPTLNLFFFKSTLELCYLELIYVCTNSMEYLVLDSQLSSKNKHVDEFRRFLHKFHQGFEQFLRELDTVATEQHVSCLHKKRDKGKKRNQALDQARADAVKTLKGAPEQRRQLEDGTSLCVKKPTPSMKFLLHQMDEILRGTHNIESQDSIGAKIFELAINMLFGFDQMISDKGEREKENQGIADIIALKKSIEIVLKPKQEKKALLEAEAPHDSSKGGSEASTSSYSTLQSSDEYRNPSTTASSGSIEDYSRHLVILKNALDHSCEKYRFIEPGGFLGLGAYDFLGKCGRHSPAMKKKMAAIKEQVSSMILGALDNVDKHQAISAIHHYIRQQITLYQPAKPPFEKRSIGYFLQQHTAPIMEEYERQTTLNSHNLDQHQAGYNEREAKTEEPDGIDRHLTRFQGSAVHISQKTAEHDEYPNNMILNVHQRQEQYRPQTQKKKNRGFSIWKRSSKKQKRTKKTSPLTRRSTQQDPKLYQTASFSPMTDGYNQQASMRRY